MQYQQTNMVLYRTPTNGTQPQGQTASLARLKLWAAQLEYTYVVLVEYYIAYNTGLVPIAVHRETLTWTSIAIQLMEYNTIVPCPTVPPAS